MKFNTIMLILLGFMLGVAVRTAVPETSAAEEVEETEEVTEYCYEPYGTDVTPEFKVTYSEVTIHWQDQPVGDNVYADWTLYEDEDGELWTECELWIRVPEKILGDPDMDGNGHEFGHCVLGDFHPEDE